MTRKLMDEYKSVDAERLEHQNTKLEAKQHPSNIGSDRARLSLRDLTKSYKIPAAHGFAFAVKAGHKLRIIDLHGLQVVDFMAWALPYTSSTATEHFSTSYTRYRLGGPAPPTVGEFLYSNHDKEMFEILHDTVKVHDTLFMACNPGFYKQIGKEGHRNCATNVAEAMNEFLSRETTKNGLEGSHQNRNKFEWFQVHDPFNLFQNTPYYSLKGGINTSKKGDYIEMRAKMDVVVCVSCCPYVEDGFNGGKVTDVAVEWEVSDEK